MPTALMITITPADRVDNDTARAFADFLAAARAEIEHGERLCLLLAPGSTAEVSEIALPQWPPGPETVTAIGAKLDCAATPDIASEPPSSPAAPLADSEPPQGADYRNQSTLRGLMSIRPIVQISEQALAELRREQTLEHDPAKREASALAVCELLARDLADALKEA